MDKTVIITFIKKYTSLLIPAGILLFGVILLIPTLMIGGSIKEKVEASAKQGQKVRRSLSSAHSEKDVVNMTAYQDQLDMDAKKVARLAKQSTQRELISYDIFPEPVDSSTQIYTDFGSRLRDQIEAILKRANARSAPTQIEIRQELEKRGSVDNRSGMEGAGGYGGGYGAGYGGGYRPSGKGRTNAYDLTRDAFLKQRAQQMAVYATANVFDWYTFWKDYKYENRQSALKDCWHSQLAFWVYEDVVDSVKSINSGSDSVFKSAVKRIVGVNFRRYADYLPETGRYGAMGGYGGGMPGYGGRSNRNEKGDSPEYVTKTGVPGVFGFPTWTTRVCDDKIDVIHFSMSVVVRADSVFSFIQELCSEKEHSFKGYLPRKKQASATYKHNQITVLQYIQEPVNKFGPEHQRYRYGDDAVVKLSLTCEYIFTRSGYDEIKPDPIVEWFKENSGAGTDTGAGPVGNPYAGG